MKLKPILTLLFLTASSYSAFAALVTYNFSGSLADPFGTLASGTPFSGSFSYDAAQPLNTPFDPDRGDYTYNQFSLNVSGQLFTYDTGVIHVYDFNPIAGTGYPVDLIFLTGALSSPALLGGVALDTNVGFVFVLQDLSGIALNGLSVPGDGLTLDNFTSGSSASFLELREAPGDFSTPFAFTRGGLSSFSAVPEPSSTLLVIAGLGSLLSVRYRTGR
jgi:hypothetical protein